MKPILTIMLAFIVSASFAQKKPKSDSLKTWSSLATTADINISASSIFGSEFNIPKYEMSFVGDWRTKYRPVDTVACIMHLHSKDSPLDRWQSGYVVLINGGVSTEFIEWKKPYIPISVGLFTNTFLGPDRKEIIKDDYVLQLILIEK